MHTETIPWSLMARFIFPVDQPPLENGIVVIQGNRVQAVEAAGSRKPDFDLGNCAVIPGLVNAHTHLDLSGLRGKIPRPDNFTGWLRAVIFHRRAMTAEDIETGIQTGLKECLRTGTTLVGDIAGMGLSWNALASAPLRAVVFYELLGLTRERASMAWKEAQSWLLDHSPTAQCRPGLSPHAPYSVRSTLFDEVAHAGFPVCVHLAETQQELELIHNRAGRFRDFLEEMGVWDPSGLVQRITDVVEKNEKVKNLLLIHGNYLDAKVALPPGSTIIYCPRTHDYFGHSQHPFQEQMAHGVRIALGTDSLASNPDLDLLAEARFLHKRFPCILGEHLLRMATLNGAAALGWEDDAGSLTPGKSADLAIVPLPARDSIDPHDLVLASEETISALMFQGKWLYRVNDG